jgi:hypothetical protein
MQTIFGVIHGDLYFHDVIEGKIPNPFTRVCQVSNLDVSCQRGVVVEMSE